MSTNPDFCKGLKQTATTQIFDYTTHNQGLEYLYIKQIKTYSNSDSSYYLGFTIGLYCKSSYLIKTYQIKIKNI